VLKEKDSSVEIVYVMSNLLKTPWGDFKKNTYLRYLQYRDNLAPDIDLRDKNIWLDLILVGMGLLGGGIALPYGGIRAVPRDDIENAKKYTAKLPLLPGIPDDRIPEHTTATISTENARTIYKDFYQRRFSKIKTLTKMGGFKSMHWIPEPDMTESSAMTRFGYDMVQSGLYDKHRRLAREVVEELIKELGLQDKVFLHSEDYNLPSGFIDDSYRASNSSFDAHVLPDYYRASCLTLSDRLVPRN
jgi:hypothetical protein